MKTEELLDLKIIYEIYFMKHDAQNSWNRLRGEQNNLILLFKVSK
jgi:hypothetical protein